jgi:hypothetical protein
MSELENDPGKRQGIRVVYYRDQPKSTIYAQSLHNVMWTLCCRVFNITMKQSNAKLLKAYTWLTIGPNDVWIDDKNNVFVSKNEDCDKEFLCEYKKDRGVVQYLMYNSAAVMASLLDPRASIKLSEDKTEFSVTMSRIMASHSHDPDNLILPEAHELINRMANNRIEFSEALDLINAAFNWIAEIDNTMISSWRAEPLMLQRLAKTFNIDPIYSGRVQLVIEGHPLPAGQPRMAYKDYFDAWKWKVTTATDFSIFGQEGHGHGVTSMALQHILADYMAHSGALIFHDDRYDILEVRLPKSVPNVYCEKCDCKPCRLSLADMYNVAKLLTYYGERGDTPPYIMSPVLFSLAYNIRVSRNALTRIYLAHCQFFAARYESETAISGKTTIGNFIEQRKIGNLQSSSSKSIRQCVSAITQECPSQTATMEALSLHYQKVGFADVFSRPTVVSDNVAAAAMLILISADIDLAIATLPAMRQFFSAETRNMFVCRENRIRQVLGETSKMRALEYTVYQIAPSAEWAEILEIEMQEARAETRKRKFTAGLVVMPNTLMAQVVAATENIFMQNVAKLQMLDYFANLICKNDAAANLRLYTAITASRAFPRNLLYAAEKPFVQLLLKEMQSFMTTTGRMQNILQPLTAVFNVSDGTHRILTNMRREFVDNAQDSSIFLQFPLVTLTNCHRSNGLPMISTCNRTIYIPYCTTFAQFEKNMHTLLVNSERFDRP